MRKTYESRDFCAACYPACSDHRSSLILLIGLLTIISFVPWACPLLAQTNGNAAAQKQGPQQHFACNVGYTPRKCHVAAMILKKALERYPVEAPGEWTWVLVRTEDWKQLLSQGRFDSNSPAFSYLPKRETFHGGALVATASIRTIERFATNFHTLSVTIATKPKPNALPLP